jgi:hypothetical protein
LEDRRPASNMDPYVVTGMIAETTILWKGNWSRMHSSHAIHGSSSSAQRYACTHPPWCHVSLILRFRFPSWGVLKFFTSVSGVLLGKSE